MIIDFPQGDLQGFRPRIEDITIQGRLHAGQYPIRRASWSVNGADAESFYLEEVPDLLLRAGREGRWRATPIDWRAGYKDSPAGLRLKRLGDFTLEIPTALLKPGPNTVDVEVEDHGKDIARAQVQVDWDPTPIAFPLDLTDLSSFATVQDVGQPINGRFEIDRANNSIRASTPADPDSLLILGSAARSQEATYRVIFHNPGQAKYVGLSDFFVRNEPEEPPIGIKPGYSTAGLATIDRHGAARGWIALGDNAHRRDAWLVFTDPPAEFVPAPETAYRVRHRLVLEADVNRVMFRIWPEDGEEPQDWLCSETDASVPPDKPRFSSASFGLFMHTGVGTEWSDVRVTRLPGNDAP